MTEPTIGQNRKGKILKTEWTEELALNPAVRDGFRLLKYGGIVFVLSLVIYPERFMIAFISYYVLGFVQNKLEERFPARPVNLRRRYPKLSWKGLLSIILFYAGLMGLIFSNFESAATWFSSVGWLVWFPSVSAIVMIIGMFVFLMSITLQLDTPYHLLLVFLMSLGTLAYLLLTLTGNISKELSRYSFSLAICYYGLCGVVIGIWVILRYWNTTFDSST